MVNGCFKCGISIKWNIIQQSKDSTTDTRLKCVEKANILRENVSQLLPIAGSGSRV